MRIGQENWRDCARRRVDGCILVIICWRRIRRHSRLWRCQLQRVTKGAAHALEVRSAVVAVVCETDPSAGRAMATRRSGGCSSCAQKAWSKFFPGLESTTRQTWEQRWTSLLKGTHLRPPKGWSSWMVARTLTVVAEAAKDCRVLIWNVRRVAGSGSVWEWSLCPETVENIFDSLRARARA